MESKKEERQMQSKEEYSKMVEQASPKSPIGSNCLKAFISGGLVCVFGEILLQILERTYTEDESALLVSIILIAIAGILTGFGLYEKMGRYCGAGTIVPITGFANSVVSAAIEFKKEGYILGLGSKMFILAGPVIVYGVLTSIVVGIIYRIIGI